MVCSIEDTCCVADHTSIVRDAYVVWASDCTHEWPSQVFYTAIGKILLRRSTFVLDRGCNCPNIQRRTKRSKSRRAEATTAPAAELTPQVAQSDRRLIATKSSHMRDLNARLSEAHGSPLMALSPTYPSVRVVQCHCRGRLRTCCRTDGTAWSGTTALLAPYSTSVTPHSLPS